MLNQFSNLSCYEEFEIQCTLTGISKIDILKEIGNQIDDYYFFISEDGIFNWFDLEGNHIKDPGVLKSICKKYIPKTIVKCIIPNSVISIGDGTFCYCTYLKKVDIPDNVIRIDSDAFWHCESLETITIPDSVTSIGYSAFAYCYSLEEITIPDNVTNIGREVFFYCDSLKEVIFKGRTLDEVKLLKNYPFGIEDENVFKFS